MQIVFNFLFKSVQQFTKMLKFNYKSQCLVKIVIFFLIVFNSSIIEIHSVNTPIAKGRFSFREMFHRNQPYDSNMQPLTEGSSLSSSRTSLASEKTVNPFVNEKVEPKSSTSFAEQDQISMKEIKLHEIEDLQQVRNVLDLNLRDSTAATNSERINPARDGVFARLRNAVFRYGVPGGVGSALTIGGLEAQKWLNNRTLNETLTRATNTSVSMVQQSINITNDTTTETTDPEDSNESSAETSADIEDSENSDESSTETSTISATTEDCDGIKNRM